jgi:hypothetical protein
VLRARSDIVRAGLGAWTLTTDNLSRVRCSLDIFLSGVTSERRSQSRLHPRYIMSLLALPTELDVRIIGYLDTRDMSRMSRVSKYYRKVSEPLFYEEVAF